MLARSLSVVLSILAALLLSLAYVLGWQSPSATTKEQVATHIASPPAVQQRRALCDALDNQLLGCDASLSSYLDPPPATSRYPEKVRRLLAIKRRHTLEHDVLRGCRGDPDAPPEGVAVTRCLDRPGCDAFAECVASIYP